MVIKDIYLLARSEELHVSKGEEVNVNLNLERAPDKPKTRIYGRVVDRCNEGIEGATVKIFTLNYEPVEHTVTDSYGDFSFNKIPPGRYYVIAVAQKYKVSRSYEIEVDKKSKVCLIITLKKEKNYGLGILYGKVRDGDGQGIGDAVVKVLSYSNQNVVDAITHTNDDGEYIVYGLKPGKYFAIVMKTGYMFQNKASFIIVANDFTKLDLFLYEEASHMKGTISGKVISKKQSVPYALVELYSVCNGDNTLIRIKRCNEDGVYLFEDIEPGVYLIRSNKLEQKVYCK